MRIKLRTAALLLTIAVTVTSNASFVFAESDSGLSENNSITASEAADSKEIVKKQIAEFNALHSQKTKQLQR